MFASWVDKYWWKGCKFVQRWWICLICSFNSKWSRNVCRFVCSHTYLSCTSKVWLREDVRWFGLQNRNARLWSSQQARFVQWWFQTVKPFIIVFEIPYWQWLDDCTAGKVPVVQVRCVANFCGLGYFDSDAILSGLTRSEHCSEVTLVVFFFFLCLRFLFIRFWYLLKSVTLSNISLSLWLSPKLPNLVLRTSFGFCTMFGNRIFGKVCVAGSVLMHCFSSSILLSSSPSVQSKMDLSFKTLVSAFPSLIRTWTHSFCLSLCANISGHRPSLQHNKVNQKPFDQEKWRTK